MDPLLVAAYSSTSRKAGHARKNEDAFYQLHGRAGRRFLPAASAVAVAGAVMIVAGLLGQ
jgi:hypothetical protein